MMILENIGVDWTDRKLICNLYNKQVAYVRIEDGLSTACTIARGVSNDVHYLHSLSLSLRFNDHFLGEPGLTPVYCSKG